MPCIIIFVRPRLRHVTFSTVSAIVHAAAPLTRDVAGATLVSNKAYGIVKCYFLSVLTE